VKLGDIKVETVPSTGKKKCEFWIGGGVGGKMKQDRPVTISDAIPFFNVWAMCIQQRIGIRTPQKMLTFFQAERIKPSFTMFHSRLIL
jgi:hypothetical protein